ncbi:hypothetical protein BOTCAL_0022g00260 [Botryotinia calthae]|uniref:Uncharacterized protein n=1 Tax=Botryotinia calthae TaxID=38488 RepID=A0A4Y8DER2_9HELO|nr:hypothetical protein BOTCAL_0022g00260 [Botryotinia calthae]
MSDGERSSLETELPLYVITRDKLIFVVIVMIIRYPLMNIAMSTDSGLTFSLAEIDPNSSELLRGANYRGTLKALPEVSLNAVESVQVDGRRFRHLDQLHTRAHSRSTIINQSTITRIKLSVDHPPPLQLQVLWAGGQAKVDG